MFGTRAYTQGALYQVPRKIPVRIEPKTYFGAAAAPGDDRGRHKPAKQSISSSRKAIHQLLPSGVEKSSCNVMYP